MAARIDHRELYRLPWNYADNGISWLEPTTACNLRCEGCYRAVDRNGHKSLDRVRSELEILARLRKSDCISIAGGDPLVYPHIVELVRLIRDMGWKPIVNSNGLGLDRNLLAELKQAGVFGFTFHVDTSQNRPHWKQASESDLNTLRLQYAEMLAEAGGIACSFNATVSVRTVDQVPALVAWAAAHADIVQTMVFILYRSPELAGDFDYYTAGRKVEMAGTYRETDWGGTSTLMAGDVVERIRRADPGYRPCAYLNGTASPASLKWLLANRIVLAGETVGYVSPRFMEIIQTANHLRTGRYLAYGAPASAAHGKLSALVGGMFDRRMRGLAGSLLLRLVRDPSRLLEAAYLQSLMIIQPVNVEADGRQDMCDGCPDITVHDGKLVWSCRLEELQRHGSMVEAAPRRTPFAP